MAYNLKSYIKATFFALTIFVQLRNEVKCDVDFWLTKGDQSVLLKKQSGTLSFGTNANSYDNILVNETKKYQKIDGFGFTLTGGSADVINRLSSSKKASLLQELFGSSETSIGISYIRLSIGASDLNSETFTYDDIPEGETDLNLDKFNLDKDWSGVIALMKEILKINPNILTLATPWTAPLWMKDQFSFKGGSLQTKYYDVYARYFVKYIQQMKSAGITIHAVTPQNEPFNVNNNPSMHMSPSEQANFIKNNLGPALKRANLATKIIIWDHNCDNTDFAKTVLADSDAYRFIDGSAFHLYNGDISALSDVHNAYPNKNLYFTEQYTPSNGGFDGDLKWHLKNVIIGSLRHWSKNALEWNLANDANYGPHTNGGCNVCKGAITVNSSESFKRNVGYYIIAHASKFVPTGSVRIRSNISGNLQNVAFITPSGSKVLIVENDGSSKATFNIKFGGKWVTTTLDAGAVGTYIWQ